MSKGLRVLLSFFSMICGWGAGFACYAGYMVFLSKWGRVTDAKALLFYTGIFIFIAWLLFFVPLVFFFTREEPAVFQKGCTFLWGCLWSCGFSFVSGLVDRFLEVLFLLGLRIGCRRDSGTRLFLLFGAIYTPRNIKLIEHIS